MVDYGVRLLAMEFLDPEISESAFIQYKRGNNMIFLINIMLCSCKMLHYWYGKYRDTLTEDNDTAKGKAKNNTQ